jgi:hypothetical protein
LLPNPRLSENQINAIVAYFEALKAEQKRRKARPGRRIRLAWDNMTGPSIAQAERRKTTRRNPEIVAFRRRENSRIEATAIGRSLANGLEVDDFVLAIGNPRGAGTARHSLSSVRCIVHRRLQPQR